MLLLLWCFVKHEKCLVEDEEEGSDARLDRNRGRESRRRGRRSRRGGNNRRKSKASVNSAMASHGAGDHQGAYMPSPKGSRSGRRNSKDTRRCSRASGQTLATGSSTMTTSGPQAAQPNPPTPTATFQAPPTPLGEDSPSIDHNPSDLIRSLYEPRQPPAGPEQDTINFSGSATPKYS